MQSKKIMVNGLRMHYITEGEGEETVLFLHGLSASSHMWKSVISIVSAHAKCIAVDLIGMGESDKNDLSCTVHEQLNFLEHFVRAMGLQKFTLVMYGWSTIVGFAYAQRYPDKINSMVFADPYFDIKKNLQDIPMALQKFQLMHQQMPEKLYEKYVDGNGIVEDIIFNSRLKRLTHEEIAYYTEMFKTRESREIYVKTLLGNPYINDKSEAITYMREYTSWLRETHIRKLMLYVTPGFVANMDSLSWAKKYLAFLTVENLGPGISFFPEISPKPFAKALVQWLTVK